MHNMDVDAHYLKQWKDLRGWDYFDPPEETEVKYEAVIHYGKGNREDCLLFSHADSDDFEDTLDEMIDDDSVEWLMTEIWNYDKDDYDVKEYKEYDEED